MRCSCIIIFSFILVVSSQPESCHVGWMRLQDKCYFFSHTTASWFDAGLAEKTRETVAEGRGQSSFPGLLPNREKLRIHEDACAQFRSKLAEPRTVTESNFLKSHCQALNVNMWIGISDIIEEDRWEFSSTQDVVKNTEFGPGEPNAHTDQNCVALWKDFHGLWADHTCTERLNFICEADAAGGNTEIIG